MMIIAFLIWFGLVQICMGKSFPPARLFLIPLFLLFYQNRRSIREKLQKLSTASPSLVSFIKVLSVLLLLVRLGQLSWRFHWPEKHAGSVEDIAIVNVKSIELLFRQFKNPYATPIDAYAIPTANNQSKVYSGLKYPPLQLFLYAPAVLLSGGVQGIFWSNLVAYLAILLLIVFELRPIGTLHASLGAFLFLSTDFFFTLAFNKGINDFFPTLFLLLSFATLQRGRQRPLLVAFFLFLSVLCKQLPGGLLLMMMLFQGKLRPSSWSLGIVLGLLFMLPFFLWDPLPLWENIIEFNLLRPVRETSLLVYLPEILQKAIPMMGILTILFFSVKGLKDPRFDLGRGWGPITGALMIFLMTAKMSPAHYFVWVLPFLILWVLSPPALKT